MRLSVEAGCLNRAVVRHRLFETEMSQCHQLLEIVASKVEANFVVARQHLFATALEALAPAGTPYRVSEAPKLRLITQKGFFRRRVAGKGVNGLNGFSDVPWDSQFIRMIV